MNYLWIAAIISIESNGNDCVVHSNSKIHGATGMSVAALIDVSMLPEDVICKKGQAIIAAWRYQKRYASLTEMDPYEMARLHKTGPGNFKKGVWPKEYMLRFKRAFEGVQ